jgi:hypothetical protein
MISPDHFVNAVERDAIPHYAIQTEKWKEGKQNYFSIVA